MPASGFVAVPTVRLNNGVDLPRIGLGVYQSPAGSAAREAVEAALEAGYRHIDTAMIYGNEGDVGAAIRATGVPRQEIFVTTKLWNDDHGYDQALAAFKASLERMQFDYIDLYMIHWPVQHLRLDTWRALEHIAHTGRARAIGVSNYMVRHLDELLGQCEITPAVNQIELSPFNYRSRIDVIDRCRAANIVVEAYSPLTKGLKLDHPVVRKIAAAIDKTPAQVLIRYALDQDTVALPKSVHRERIIENLHVFDFTLTEEQIRTLDQLDERLATGWDPTDAP